MDRHHPKYNEDFLKLRTDPKAGDGKWEYFTLRDGTRMFVQYWLPEGEGANRVLVCLHGLSAHGWYFSRLADALVPAGIGVYAPDYRGHGLSDGVKGDLPGVAQIVDDMKEFVGWVRSRHPGAKVFTLGESMGGAVNVNLMIDAPELSNGMVLLAPAIKPAMKFTWKDILKTPFYLLALLIHSSWRVVRMTGDEHRGMRDPENIRYDRNDPLHLKYISVRYLLGIKRIMDRAAKEGPAVRLPSLIVQGGRDVAVSPQGTRSFHDALASTDKTFKFYPEALHCMQMDPDCKDMLSIIREWMLAR